MISLNDKDKAWLGREAARVGVSMAELIRRGVALLRERQRRESPGLDELLDRTRGTWKGGDGLAYQRRVRSEWNERPRGAR